MICLRVRWSEHEARKPYARPFGVTFLDGAGDEHGSIAVSGQDLLYLRQFQTAVLALSGELFDDPSLRDEADPQHAWLDVLAAALPAVSNVMVQPQSTFHHDRGRVFTFSVRSDEMAIAEIEAPELLEYQDFQAAVAHQSGRLFRAAEVEAVDDQPARQAAWTAALREIVRRPSPDDAMTAAWPWR